MRLDAGLDSMEDGYVTEAEQVDQETEIEDMQSLLDDDIMDPDSLDTDMEGAYEGFHDNEGFKGIPVGAIPIRNSKMRCGTKRGLIFPKKASMSKMASIAICRRMIFRIAVVSAISMPKNSRTILPR